MSKKYLTILGYVGLAVLSIAIYALAQLTPELAYEIPWLDRPNTQFIGWLMLAGLAYLLTVCMLQKKAFISPLLIVLLGLLLRLALLGSTPVYEDDFYRYFWDAELIGQGLNPYAHAPIDALPSPFPETELLRGEALAKSPVERLSDLPYLNRVAYPTIRTIYPPVAQAVFAMAHFVAPADLIVWRGILLIFDCVSVALLLMLLKTLHKNQSLIAIYWLNPVLLFQTVNAAHMDVLLIPFLLGSALLALKFRHTLSGLMLAVAVGIKLWPVILAPLLFRPLLGKPKKLILSALSFLVVSLILLAPQLVSRLDHKAGLIAYAETWQTNAFIFPLLNGLLSGIFGADTTGIWDPEILSRLVVVLIIFGTILHLLPNWREDREMLPWAILWTTAVLFLFSPTGYPWYFLWILPWLAIKPNWGLLLLSVTLPLYYFRFPLEASGRMDVFEDLYVTLQFLPTLLLIVYSFYRQKTR